MWKTHTSEMKNHLQKHWNDENRLKEVGSPMFSVGWPIRPSPVCIHNKHRPVKNVPFSSDTTFTRILQVNPDSLSSLHFKMMLKLLFRYETFWLRQNYLLYIYGFHEMNLARLICPGCTALRMSCIRADAALAWGGTIQSGFQPPW